MTYTSPYYKKNTTCQLCHHDFQTTNILSRFVKFSGRDTDFFPFYQDINLNPLYYHIHICPKCGFAYTEEFSSYFPPLTKEKIQDKLLATQIKDFGGIRTLENVKEAYNRALACAHLKNEKNIVIGGLYMRMAWIQRMLHSKEQEQYFLSKTCDYYVQSYQLDDFAKTKMSETRLLYLIGECYRRLGNYKEAISYYGKVVEKKRHTSEQRIIEMARDAWYRARQESKAI
ncbi:DUF2225 domain-containing protein [Bacillus sp. 2205SS5-2]|uniref:DUF2225 domain-containing protein n=1 Tax=Bacillus sp. 2205SS5-2 TaxID=3109031 RepID=UPI003007C37B